MLPSDSSFQLRVWEWRGRKTVYRKVLDVYHFWQSYTSLCVMYSRFCWGGESPRALIHRLISLYEQEMRFSNKFNPLTRINTRTPFPFSHCRFRCNLKFRTGCVLIFPQLAAAVLVREAISNRAPMGRGEGGK